MVGCLSIYLRPLVEKFVRLITDSLVSEPQALYLSLKLLVALQLLRSVTPKLSEISSLFSL
jgi:hypothetical protein